MLRLSQSSIATKMQDLKHEEERSWWDMSDWSQEQVGRGMEMSGFATIAEVKEGRGGGTLQSGLAVGTIRVSGWIVGVIVQIWEV